jgi:hypothetical protein
MKCGDCFRLNGCRVDRQGDNLLQSFAIGLDLSGCKSSHSQLLRIPLLASQSAVPIYRAMFPAVWADATVASKTWKILFIMPFSLILQFDDERSSQLTSMLRGMRM